MIKKKKKKKKKILLVITDKYLKRKYQTAQEKKSEIILPGILLRRSKLSCSIKGRPSAVCIRLILVH